jgi:hypothetical protein
VRFVDAGQHVQFGAFHVDLEQVHRVVAEVGRQRLHAHGGRLPLVEAFRHPRAVQLAQHRLGLRFLFRIPGRVAGQRGVVGERHVPLGPAAERDLAHVDGGKPVQLDVAAEHRRDLRYRLEGQDGRVRVLELHEQAEHPDVGADVDHERASRQVEHVAAGAEDLVVQEPHLELAGREQPQTVVELDQRYLGHQVSVRANARTDNAIPATASAAARMKLPHTDHTAACPANRARMPLVTQ